VIRWNADKRYLVDLAEAGVATVPTVVVERGDCARTLADRAGEAGWDEVVIKPAVSGAGRETYRLNARPDRPASEPHDPAAEALWQRRVAQEDMLIQPFVPAIVDSGEVSLVVIDGEATHAVRKIAAPGEFRVQDDHGGTVHMHRPTARETDLAERAIAAAVERTAAAILYARVDLVDAETGPQVMELELIEPELFLRHRASSAGALARAVLAGA
jgi:glutathione synthase/RimK-type ligase-like ATP-grasp enzyme